MSSWHVQRHRVTGRLLAVWRRHVQSEQRAVDVLAVSAGTVRGRGRLGAVYAVSRAELHEQQWRGGVLIAVCGVTWVLLRRRQHKCTGTGVPAWTVFPWGSRCHGLYELPCRVLWEQLWARVSIVQWYVCSWTVQCLAGVDCVYGVPTGAVRFVRGVVVSCLHWPVRGGVLLPRGIYELDAYSVSARHVQFTGLILVSHVP